MTNPIEQEQTYTLTHKEIEYMLKSCIFTGQIYNNKPVDEVLKLWAKSIYKMIESEDKCQE